MKLNKYFNTKNISKILALGVLLSSIPINSFASVLSEDGRYETFECDNLTINNVLEEDKVDVEIKGNTLVNNCLNSTKDGIIIDKTIKFDSSMIKPNTEYTLIFEIPENNLNEDERFVIELHSTNMLSKARVFPGETGKFIKKVRTYDTVNLIPWISNDTGIVKGSVLLKNLMVLEGDWTDKTIPEYFEGIKSSFENTIITQEMINSGEEKEENLGKYKVEIDSIGKNLFDGKMEYGYLGDNNGIITEPNRKISISSSNFIKINEDKLYSISLNASKGNFSLYCYDKNKSYLGYFSYGSNYPTKLEFKENTQYIKFRFFVGNSGEINLDDLNWLQIEEGSIATEYEPYKESINTFYLDSPLLKGDTIKYINGQATHIQNTRRLTFNGDEDWSRISTFTTENYTCFSVNVSELITRGKDCIISNRFIYNVATDKEEEGIWESYLGDAIRIKVPNSIATTNEQFKIWLQSNPVTVNYKLVNPIYEPINFDAVQLYLGNTYISTNSTIPANLKVTVDRVTNRAKESSELAKENPTLYNISLARMWINLMRESILKDEFHDTIDTITEIEDMVLEKKKASANIDLYIKSENLLSMSLNTNSISFEDFSGVEDMAKDSAVNISINSSLPYNLNSYLATDIQNTDKSTTMNLDMLSIRENSELNYQKFSAINSKLILKSNCESGNNKQHNIDLKLNAGVAHEKDVYKTTIKFEAEQL